LSYTPEEVNSLAQRSATLRLTIPALSRFGFVKL